MKYNISASGVVQDYQRRNINPDKIKKVKQGLLLMWQFGNEYVCELRLGAISTKRTTGEISITGGEYVNTYSPQEIADDIQKELSDANINYINACA